MLYYLNETLDTVLYNKQQYGFRSGIGCETRLCATYHDDIAKAVDRSSVVHEDILDFQKAFEKVPHYLL